MTRGLTARQSEVLGFINSFVDANGYPPTVREVADHFGFRSPRAAHDHMKALVKKGYVRTQAGKPRALEVLRGRGIPVLGRIAAGEPMLAVEEADHSLDLDPAFFGPGQLFALKVRGESMVEAHIADGDMVILRAQETAQPGEVVAVIMDDEVTLKQFYPHPDHVELRPANQAMESIRARAEDMPRILGVMKGLVRRS